ncbi:MAG: hypothetical protein HS103_13115 [Anaerolineales bacterium]|nr:hypothetical protein [Anaerolineales bacterium]
MFSRKQFAQKRGTRGAAGQALVEYVLIVTLVVFALVAILTVTGPAIGNVFSNTVYNILNQTTTPREPFGDATFWQYATAVASYTPAPFEVKTNTPVGQDPNQNNPPIARPDAYTFDTAGKTVFTFNVTGSPFPLLLANDEAPALDTTLRGDTITLSSCSAVVAITPVVPNVATVSCLPNGEFTFVLTNTTFEGYVSFTYQIIDSEGLTASAGVTIGIDALGPPPPSKTPTPQPSATPADMSHSFPFYDSGDSSTNWHINFSNVVHGPWDVQYYNSTNFTNPVGTVGSLFWRPTRQTLNEDWGGGVPSALLPNPDAYSVRWSVASTPMQSRLYEVRLTANGAATFRINGTIIAQIAADNGTAQTVTGLYNGTAGNVSMSLDFAETMGDASVILTFNVLADQGNCRWAPAGAPYHTASSSWHDSPGSASYGVDSTCSLRLRGYIDIPATRADTTPTQPILSFWETYALNTNDKLQIGVRDYDAPDNWSWFDVHTSADADNLNWKQQTYSLTNFMGNNFRGKKIEVAFRVISVDGNVANGWFVDDIRVEDSNPRLYVLGWGDNVDNDGPSPNSNDHFLNECNWQRVTAVKKSGTHAWHDSPGAGVEYPNGSDCSLTLNGLVDLSPNAAEVEPIELTFWSKSDLNTATDQAIVQYRLESEINNPLGWVTLSPTGSPYSWIAKAPTSNTWTQVYVDLSALKGQKFQLRFRLTADTDNNQADGWYLDDILIRRRPQEFVGIPFYEPFDSAARWTMTGTWGVTTDTVTPPISGPTALTDSPGVGVNYAPTSNSYAELVPQIDLAGTIKPILTFWSFWEAPDPNLLLEVSTDNGATWSGTPLWQKPGAQPVQRAWYRHRVDLTSFIGQRIKLRFRLQVAAATGYDGWYIDDLLVEEEGTAARKLTDGTIIYNLDGTNPKDDWYAGGAWTVTPSVGVGNTSAFSDSPADYLKPAISILEPKTRFDLVGSVSPTLYFWTKFETADVADKLHVDISENNGATWSTPVWTNPEPANLGWHRVAINLDAYKTKVINIRFRFQAMTTTTSGDGWYIDNVTVYDRTNMANLGVTMNDEFNDLSKWVAEGAWTAVPTMWSGWSYRPETLVPTNVTYGGTVTTSNWVADYWHIAPSDTGIWTAGGVVFPGNAPNVELDTSVAEINFNYQADTSTRPFSPAVTQWQVSGVANHEYYLMKWRRSYQVLSGGGTYRLRLTMAGGAQLYVNGNLTGPSMSLEKPFQTVSGMNSNPWVTDSRLRTYYYEITVSGTFTLELQYHHKTLADSGPGQIELAFAERSSVARTSDGTAATNTYPNMYRTSLILNGYLTIQAGKVANIGYQERWSLTDTDYGKVYYSYDDGFTWTEVTSVQRSMNNPQGGGWSAGSTQDWVNTSFVLKDPITGNTHTVNRKVILKFELDSKINTAVDEGWLIDNFQFVLGDNVANIAPLSSTITIQTVTNSQNSAVPTIVDTPGDTHTLSIIAQPFRGTVAVVGNQIRYTPPAEWTGATTFVYRVTDQGSLTVDAVGYAYVEPYFYRGVNVGDTSGADIAPSVVIDGNTWDAWGTNTSSSNTGSNYITASLSPPVTGDMATMLSTGRRRNTTDNWAESRVTMSNVQAGVYTAYIYVTTRTTTTVPYDIMWKSMWSMRIVNDANPGPTVGNWRRYGPYTLHQQSTGNFNFYQHTANGVGMIAGIELWRGGDYLDWTSMDIGDNDFNDEGTTTGGGSTVTLTGGGWDIWTSGSQYDEFRYAYKIETGSVRITAQVRWPTSPVHEWSFAGLMLRSEEWEGSPQVTMGITRDHGRNWVRRQTWNGSSVDQNEGTVATGTSWYWVRVEFRHDLNRAQAFVSTDGVNWTQYGSNQTINLPNRYMVGLAATSLVEGTSVTAEFRNVTIEQISPQKP